VARDLTGGSPGSHFSARVLARIDESGRTRSGWHPALAWSPAVAVVMILVAMIVIAVIRVGWGAHRVIAPTQAHQAPVASPPLASVPITTQAPERALVAPETALGAARAPQASRAARRTPLRTALVTGESQDESPLGALAPERLDVAPMTIVALTPAESIQLSEMNIPSIDVTPLERDGRPHD